MKRPPAARRTTGGEVTAVFEQVWTWMAIAYLVAAIPVGLLIARARGVDLRRAGSGNIGATNAVRVMGSKWGLFVFALDVLKAFVPTWLATKWLFTGGVGDHDIAVALVGLSAVLGHIFPVYLGFRGGKGVACALGVFAALDPPAALAALVLYGQGLALTRISAVGSLTAVTAMTLTELVADRPRSLQILACVVAVLIWVRHHDNVRSLVRDARERKRVTHGNADTSG